MPGRDDDFSDIDMDKTFRSASPFPQTCEGGYWEHRGCERIGKRCQKKPGHAGPCGATNPELQQLLLDLGEPETQKRMREIREAAAEDWRLKHAAALFILTDHIRFFTPAHQTSHRNLDQTRDPRPIIPTDGCGTCQLLVELRNAGWIDLDNPEALPRPYMAQQEQLKHERG